MGPFAGFDPIMRACVEAGVLEALFYLAKNPRKDFPSIVYKALDTVNDLIIVASRSEREALLERAAACDALETCLNVGLVVCWYRVEIIFGML